MQNDFNIIYTDKFEKKKFNDTVYIKWKKFKAYKEKKSGNDVSSEM